MQSYVASFELEILRNVTMSLKDKLFILFSIASPLLGNIMEERIIPKAVKIAYQVLDNFIDGRIEALVELLGKVEKTSDKEKRDRHIKGFTLGVEFLQALSNKLSDACKILNEELEGVKNGLQG